MIFNKIIGGPSDMSLTKIWNNIFKKDVITFVIIRRHDLGILDEKLRYVSVKPSASISVLRQKVWHLLDLPDFCEEVIILKANEREISLSELCKGNDPMHPYVLEVWLPESCPIVNTNNMLTMGKRREHDADGQSLSIGDTLTQAKFSSETITHPDRIGDVNHHVNLEYGRSNLSCKISNSSLFFKLNGKKSRDNFASMLFKIQHDLSSLSEKLLNIEQRLPA